MSRFRSAYDDLSLLELVVPAVAREADPEHPEQVSQRAYDRARADAGYPDAPSAAATARRLGYSWAELLELALDPERDAARNLALRQREEAAAIDEVTIRWALEVVGRTIADEDPLRPEAYDAAREELVAADRRAWAHGGQLCDLPTADQIATAMKTEDEAGWDRALALIDLEPRGPVVLVKGLDPLEVGRRFLTDIGTLPWSGAVLVKYSSQAGHSLRRLKPGDMDQVRSKLQREWREQGRWVPERPLRREDRPPLEVPTPTQFDPGRKPARTDEECFSGLLRALELAEERGQRLTQDLYQRLAKGRPELPAYSTVAAHARKQGTTFAGLRSKAIKEREKRSDCS